MRFRSRSGNRLRFLCASRSTITFQVIEQFLERHVLAARDCRLPPGDCFEFARLGFHDGDAAGGAGDVLPDGNAQ